MAKFNVELPNALIKEFEKIETSADDMFDEMVQAGSRVIYSNIRNNMNRVFKSTKSLEKGLKIARPKKLRKNDGYGGWVGFDGYTKDGTPIPLIAMAREYGTSRGEAKKPFLRTAIHKSEIESAMLNVQNKYLPKE